MNTVSFNTAFKLVELIHILVTEMLHGIRVTDFNYSGEGVIAHCCVLPLTFLTTNKGKFLFICLVTICLASFVKEPDQVFNQFSFHF